MILLKRNLAGVVICVLVFLVFGPAIGLIGGMVPIAFWERGSWEGFLDSLRYLPFAYVFGGPSALAVGVVYSALAFIWTERMRGPVVRVAVGMVLGAAGAGIISGLAIGLSMVAAVCAGVSAGAICALMLGFEVPHTTDGLAVKPDNSLERTLEE